MLKGGQLEFLEITRKIFCWIFINNFFEDCRLELWKPYDFSEKSIFLAFKAKILKYFCDSLEILEIFYFHQNEEFSSHFWRLKH